MKGKTAMPLAIEERKTRQTPHGFMKANVFRASGKFGLEEKPIPHAWYGEAVVQVRLNLDGSDHEFI